MSRSSTSQDSRWEERVVAEGLDNCLLPLLEEALKDARPEKKPKWADRIDRAKHVREQLENIQANAIARTAQKGGRTSP